MTAALFISIWPIEFTHRPNVGIVKLEHHTSANKHLYSCFADCSDYVICAASSTDRLNPFGPFTVDYQVRGLCSHLTSSYRSHFVSACCDWDTCAVDEAALEQSAPECGQGVYCIGHL